MVKLDKKMLEDAPTYDAGDEFQWTADYGQRIDKYYNVPTYWQMIERSIIPRNFARRSRATARALCATRRQPMQEPAVRHPMARHCFSLNSRRAKGEQTRLRGPVPIRNV